MSQSNIPNITPVITVSRDDAINLLLSSIAMEELGLSHIINAEGEKLQYVLGTLPGLTGPGATLSDLLLMNESVRSTLQDLTKKNGCCRANWRAFCQLRSLSGRLDQQVLQDRREDLNRVLLYSPFREQREQQRSGWGTALFFSQTHLMYRYQAGLQLCKLKTCHL